MVFQTRTSNFIELLHFLVCQFTLSFNTFLSMSFHVVRLCNPSLREALPNPGYFSVAPAEILDSNICLYSSIIVSFGLHSRWTHPKMYVTKKWCGFVKINVFHQFLPHGSHIPASFQPFFVSSTYTDKNNPCFRWTNRHSQFCTFSHPSFNRTSSNRLFHTNPADGCPYRFRSRRTTKSSMFAHDFGHLCRGRRICISGHSDFGSEQSGSILHFYLGVSRHCVGCLSVTIRKSRNNINCSEKKSAQVPESSFTMSPRSTTLRLYLCNWGFLLRVFEVTYVYICSKVDFL